MYVGSVDQKCRGVVKALDVEADGGWATAERLVGHDAGAASRAAQLVGAHEEELANEVHNGTVNRECVGTGVS